MRQSQLHCVSYSYCMVLIMCAYWCGVCSYGSRILAFIQVLMKKTWQFTTSCKDDGSKVAELKQQISQNFTAHCRNVTVLRSNIIFCDICCFSSAIFAAVVLIRCCKLSSFFINICCVGGMYRTRSLGIFKVHAKQPRHTCHSASACRILSKSDHSRQIYDVTSIFQDGGQGIAILLSVSVSVISFIWEGQNPPAYQISARYLNPRLLLLSVSENKRPPCWNSTSGSDFNYVTIGMSFCICLYQISSKLDGHAEFRLN